MKRANPAGMGSIRSSRHNGEDDHLAARIIEQQMPLGIMMALRC